jgi:outer membrane receptor for ferrienterochelin and colicins
MKTSFIIKDKFYKITIPLLAFSTTVNAQQSIEDSTEQMNYGRDPKLLKNIVVTGQYIPQSIEKAVQRVRVIDSKKIQSMGAQNLRDVLLNEMNVTISQDNALGSSIQIQGISGQNVKILVDGVPVIGRQNGNIDASQLNVYNVERIEVIEGPMSVNYGTDALAGTINIITKSSIQNKVEAGVNTYVESIGKYNINANAAFKQKNHTVIVSGARNFFDGWSPGDAIKLFDFSNTPADSSRNKLWNPKEEYNGSFQYSYKFKKAGIRFKSDYFQDKITNRSKPRGFYGYNAFDDIYNTTRFNNALFADANLKGNNRINFLIAYNHYKRLKNTFDKDLVNQTEILGPDNDQDTSFYNNLNSRATLTRSTNNNRVGYELGYDINIESAEGRRVKSGSKSIGDYAIYSSAEIKVTDSLTVRAGLRYAYNTAYNAPLIPSLNVKYNFLNGLVFRGSYARGFRAPGVKELFFEFNDSNHDIIGNDNLKSENSNNFNGALTYLKRINDLGLKLEVATFHNSISDMISLAMSAVNGNKYTYINIDKFKSKGLQFNVNTEYKNWSATLGSSYVGRYNNIYSSDTTGIAKQFSYTPEVRVNVVYDIKKFKTNISLFSKYTGKMPSYRYDTDENVVLSSVNPYFITDLTMTKMFFENSLVVSLGCKNIFNVTNINITGGASTGSAHSSSSSSISFGTGRSYFVSLGYKFNKK